MNGTEKIIAHVMADAKDQAGAILAEAEKQCAEITADYTNKAAALFEKKMEEGKKAIEDSEQSRSRLTTMEGKKSILALKQEMVEKSFKRACEMILSMDDKAYTDFLTKLILSSSSTGDEKIIFNEKDRKKFAENAVAEANRQKNAHFTVADETGDFLGGVMLKRGSVTVNNTVELLIDLKKSEMAGELAKLLFD